MAQIIIGAPKKSALPPPSIDEDDDGMLLSETDEDEIVDPPVKAETVSPYQAPKRDVLDRSKTYGTVHSSAKNKNKAKFWQGGRHYDALGVRIMIPGDEEHEAKLAEERQRTAQERAQRLRERAVAVEKGMPDPEDLNDPDAINLTLWGEGEVDYLFSYVRKTIEQRYHKVVHNIANAVDFLIEEKVIDGRKARKVRQGKR